MALTSHVTEAAFIARRNQDWAELERLTQRAANQDVSALEVQEVTRISPLYRDICADLARAQAARYSAPLVDYLHALTASAHSVLYALPPRPRFTFSLRGKKSAFLAFPRAVRAHWPTMLLAAFLFFGPFLFGAIASIAEPSFAFRVVPESQLRPLVDGYAKGFATGRQAGEGAMMAGFYVNNNVGIALRCFATGIFGGLGSAFYLVQNGLAIGAILGYVASQGAGGNLLLFIIGHSAFELGAIVIAGGAGMSLGWSIIAPGNKTRLASLQSAGRDVAVIVSGAAVMLLIAAAIEAFWSASSMPAVVKVIFGATWLLVVLSYIFLAGQDEPWERT
ncbi:stage II sporulation protein M [Pendulispora brunnea]|uniref:Stage II sporulation protein M n=1 Tax=Pendulispora brunnea TaxID=2905690 RepID=A0ABZ2KFZ3_9BACT